MAFAHGFGVNGAFGNPNSQFNLFPVYTPYNSMFKMKVDIVLHKNECRKLDRIQLNILGCTKLTYLLNQWTS